MPIVEVPPRYRGPTGGLKLIAVEADTVRSCIAAAEVAHPRFQELVIDAGGNLHDHTDADGNCHDCEHRGQDQRSVTEHHAVFLCGSLPCPS